MWLWSGTKRRGRGLRGRQGRIAFAIACIALNVMVAAAASAVAAQQCPSTPAANCLLAAKARMAIYNDVDDTKDQFAWKWGKGQGMVQAAFGDPTTSAGYSVCIYAGSTQARVAEAVLPAGPGWSLKTKGYGFKGSNANGLSFVKLKAGETSKPHAMVRGRGAALPDFAMPLAAPVTIQFIKDDASLCLQSTYADSDIDINDAHKFLAYHEMILPWPEGTLPPTSLCNKAGDDGSVAEQLGAQIRRSGSEWATACLSRFGAGSSACDVSFGGDSTSPYVPDMVPSLVCPNEATCDLALGRVEWHAEDKFGRRCTLDEWALVWGTVEQRSRALGRSLSCDVTSFAPRTWGVYSCYEQNFVLPVMQKQLDYLRSYVSPNPPMTAECEAAIVGRIWWRLGSDWIRYGDYLCPEAYYDDEMQGACGTQLGTPMIDKATWDAWCTEFADILRPVYEGARASSNKPY